MISQSTLDEIQAVADEQNAKRARQSGKKTWVTIDPYSSIGVSVHCYEDKGRSEQILVEVTSLDCGAPVSVQFQQKSDLEKLIALLQEAVKDLP